MLYYLVTAHFLLTQTIKYSHQCINSLKTQNDSNTLSNLATSLKAKNIYILTSKYTNVVISMIGCFSRVYTSSVHVMNGKKSVQQSITKIKWFEVPLPHDLLPYINPPILSSIKEAFFSFYFQCSVRIFLLSAFTV